MRRAELAPLKRAMQAAEQRVTDLAAEIARLDETLADPALYAREPERARALAVARAKQAQVLTVAEQAWLEASEAYETAAEGIAGS